MKKIYFLLLIIFQAGMSLAQDFDSFQFRLVVPGGEPGIFRVQMRAVLPTDIPTTGDVCSELAFKVWWDNVANPSIMDVTVVSGIVPFTVGPVVTENNSETGVPGKAVAISLSALANFPTNWMLNQWAQIATLNICSNVDCSPAGAPPGITGAAFHIQGFDGVQLPAFEMNADGNYYVPLNNGPLPLNLISFHADKSGERDAHLSWTTANEENTSHFIIERSFDKENWEDVGKVGAAGYSVDIRNYEFYDVDVNNSRSSRVRPYYRLKMVDLDGRSTLSPIESVVFNNSATTALNAFEVYPNPAADGVHIQWEQENTTQPTSLEFYDIAGKLVYRQIVSDKTTQEYIDFGPAKIQSGVYMLRILNGAEPLDHQQIVVGQNR